MVIIYPMHQIEQPPRLAAALAAVDLNLVVVLSVLLDEASVTRTAARLGRTQSAVSHALDRLRAALGDPLFVRSGARMLPTPRAEALRAPVADIVSRLHDLWVSAPPFDPAHARRRISLVASDYLQIVLVPQIVRRLRVEAPSITLEVRGPHGALLESLSQGDYDFSFAVTLPDSPSLYSQKLFDDRFVCLVDVDHPSIRRPRDLDRATFLRLPHALITPLGGTTGHVDAALAVTGESRHVAVRLPDFMVAPRVLRGTDLLLTLPERVARLFEGEGLRLLPPPLALPKLSGHLVWHERLARDPCSLWFRSLLEDITQVRRTPPARRPR
ncbi:MAG: LysR family transcriptional regulator [Polyangiaceae bacterium]